jgi:uncharacterized protein YodC (DUF2158 family)
MTAARENSSLAEETPLAVGDTIRLKSGGHLMTVVGIDKGSIECAWSIRDDCKSGKFPVAAVVKSGTASPWDQMTRDQQLDVARRIAFLLNLLPEARESLERIDEKT